MMCHLFYFFSIIKSKEEFPIRSKLLAFLENFKSKFINSSWKNLAEIGTVIGATNDVTVALSFASPQFSKEGSLTRQVQLCILNA